MKIESQILTRFFHAVNAEQVLCQRAATTTLTNTSDLMSVVVAKVAHTSNVVFVKYRTTHKAAFVPVYY